MDSTYTKVKMAWRPNVARASRNLAAFVYSSPTKIWPSISTKSQENISKGVTLYAIYYKGDDNIACCNNTAFNGEYTLIYISIWFVT